MKRMTLTALLISAFTLSIFAGGKQPIAFKDLPKDVQKEVSKSYNEKEIQFITEKKEINRHYSYEFTLKDNTTFIYDDKAKLRVMENPDGIRDVFVPEKILKYVQTTFPNTQITRYKKERSCQRVELSEKMELIFDNYNHFVRINE